uniref:Cytochrome c oxidase subunit 3 n=1 Tax=Apis andreniformis TaxID=7464 RepID=A0A067YI06_9HYME|nr:cytochrome c oxidase subunit III [Apis andreniformis]AGI56720.1 cytochrome c oxidase subunit III [Apis andreniformis]AHC32070.1 Cytochrome c oxidase subunit III [Apis andreniformis]BBC54799.1 cytochrome oxidase subunit 3 [Apis andreniformis]
MKKNFPFHMVTNSPWPIIMSFSLLNMLMSTIIWIYLSNNLIMVLNLFNTMLTVISWFRDIIRESTFQGVHTMYVSNFLKFSMVLFILSELMFFVSFFWTFFHSSISPSIEVDMIWPPKDIKFFNPFEIPLLNSFILVTSGFTVTLSHYYLINNNARLSKNYLFFSIFLGVYFTILQSIEYMNSYFCFNDSIYGSIFFMATGFHGLHVLIGSMFLIVSFYRMNKVHFSNMHNINFELAIWYWHFVDVIWLFLYTFIYLMI